MSRVIWGYLEKLAGYLQNISRVLKLVPMDERHSFKRQFRDVMRVRTRTSAFSFRRPKLRTNSTCIPNIISETEKFLFLQLANEIF